MKIKQAIIYGFGKWVDDSIDLSKDGLICIYGENESGKSTLQNFILFMLFGLPPKKRAFFRPKTSGKMGGRLMISDPKVGEYTIERIDEVNNGAAICYLPGGQTHDEGWLKDQLKGMTRDIYESIFSFSASDLNDLTTMKDEDLGEVLLGIGLTGSNNIYTIEKQLDQKIGKLFKRTGTVPVINKQLTALDNQFIELTDAKNNESTYRPKQEQIQTLIHEMKQSQSKLQKIKEKQLTIEKKQRNLSVISDYHLYTEQLFNHSPKQPFPENGIERLNLLKEQLLPLKSEYTVLQANQKEYQKNIHTLQNDLLKQAIHKQIQEVLQDEQQYHKDQQAFDRLIETIQTLQQKNDTALRELNIGLTLESLTQLSLPFYTETTWKELKNKADHLQLEREQLEREQRTLKEQQHFLTEQLREIENELLTPKQQDELYAQLDHYKEHSIFKKLATEANEQSIQWKKVKQSKEKSMRTFFISSVIVGLLASGIGYLVDLSILYYVALLIVITGLGQMLWGKQSIKETTNLLANHQQIANPARQVSESQKQEWENLLVRDDENRSSVRSMQDQLKAIDIQFIQWNEKLHSWNQRETNVNSQLDVQQATYPFLKQIELSHWPDFYHILKKLLDRLHEEQKQQEQADQYEESLIQYHQTVKELCEMTHSDFVHSSFEYEITILKDMAQKHKESNQSIKQYEQMIAENEANQTNIKEKMSIYQEEIQELFVFAQVETEDEFYNIAKINKEREEMEGKIQQLNEQLRAVFTEIEWQALIKDKPDQNKLEIDYQQNIQDYKELEEEIHAKRQDLADLNADIMNMETSEVYSQIMHRFSLEKEQLKTQAKAWAVLKTAKEMLTETKRSYRDKYLTSVMSQASIYFQKVTDNRYVQVIPPINNQPFQVETADRVRYQVNELSQGTIDQLYVCLRLAISEIMSEKHAVPFIMDDAFVHFDGPRTLKMMEILSDIASKQQVIIFTCKEEVKNSLPNHDIIYLTDGMDSK